MTISGQSPQALDAAHHHAAFATTFIQDSTRMARQLGPIFHRKFFGLEFDFACGPDIVAELSDEQRFEKNVHPSLMAWRPLMGDGLISAYGHEPNLKTASKVLAPAFSQSALRRYHGEMLDVAGQLIDKWDRAAGGPAVDVAPDMTRVTLETIARAGFGYSFRAFQSSRPDPFVVALLDSLLHSQRMLTRAPIVGGLLGRKAEERNTENIAYLNKIVDDVIAARRREGYGNDLLGLMLSSGALDPVNIRYQIITFLAAGHETTSGALAFTLYYLTRHDDIMQRCRAEINSVWGTRTPAFDDVPKLRYLKRAIDESLRLWPTVPGYARQAREDTVLKNGYPMQAGDSLFVLTPALHRDPVWEGDTEEFDPDRFLPDRIRSRPPHVYKPFGTGARACIGRQFALHEATLVIGLLLRLYNLNPEPDYELRVQERVTLQPAGFRLHVTLR
jgi:cytochrome P450